MAIHIAKSIDEVQAVKELAKDEVWSHARRFLEHARNHPFADHLLWLEEDGRPVACVQVFLHQYPIGCARVGMCLPEYPFVPPALRGRGHFKRLMADLFGWMGDNGYPLAYSHGRKGLYTGIGYAPCYHHCTVLLRVADALRLKAPRMAERATHEDIVRHEGLLRRPFPLGRGMQCRDEGWRPDPRCVRLVRLHNSDELAGFLVTGRVLIRRAADGTRSAGLEAPDRDAVVTVTDSWSAGKQAAAGLLHAVADEARELGATWLRLNVRRQDPLARVAVLAGGELRWSAAQERDWTENGEDVDAFYLADLALAVEQMQPELNARWQRFGGRVPSGVVLATGEEQVTLDLGPDLRVTDAAPDGAPCLRLPRRAMVRAIMGYATPTELAPLHDGCEIPRACRKVADALFPAREPHLIHENAAFAEPEQFGLVP